jgi:hypothetical protein
MLCVPWASAHPLVLLPRKRTAGWLANCRAPSLSLPGRSRGTPFRFPLGGGRVIKGWDEGLLDMCVGEKRTLTVGPDYGYGQRAVGPIPAGSTLSASPTASPPCLTIRHFLGGAPHTPAYPSN